MRLPSWKLVFSATWVFPVVGLAVGGDIFLLFELAEGSVRRCSVSNDNNRGSLCVCLSAIAQPKPTAGTMGVVIAHCCVAVATRNLYGMVRTSLRLPSLGCFVISVRAAFAR